jgi:hypothetical protein
VKPLAQVKTDRAGPVTMATSASQRARGIVDLSGTKLMDRPSFLEEKLLKTRGVVAAEINAFSNRMIVEFDPSIISLDKIKAMIRANGG